MPEDDQPFKSLSVMNDPSDWRRLAPVCCLKPDAINSDDQLLFSLCFFFFLLGEECYIK